MQLIDYIIMKSWIIYIVGLSFVLLSCSVVSRNDYSVHESEVVGGMILISSKACFFVPNGYCNYLACDNSSGEKAKALIIDHLERINDVNLRKPIVANINMLPNKDSSDIIVWLERCRFDFVEDDECYIIPATVKLTTRFRPIQNLSFSYILRFSWKDIIYHYECIYIGSQVYCNIISINESQMDKIINMQSLPIGKERG